MLLSPLGRIKEHVRMSVSRIYRVLRLITMLQSGRNYTVSELASELFLHEREFLTHIV